MPKKALKGSNTDEESKETSQKLIDVAVDLFSDKGFKATSIREIAMAMGMTTSNIYHYYGTKAGLLTAIEQNTLTPLMAEFRRIKALDLPPIERFVTLLRTHLSYMHTHRKETKIFSFYEESTPLSKKFQTETYKIYRSEIERLAESVGRDINASVATFCTLGVVIWFLRWYDPKGRIPIEEIIESMTDFVLSGIIGVNYEGKKKR